jgi:hypothetical protein
MDQASLLEMCTLLFWPMIIFSISKDDHRGKCCSMKIGVLETIFDDIVKSPYAALRCILRHCGVRPSTPHSSGFARLAFGAFYFVV